MEMAFRRAGYRKSRERGPMVTMGAADALMRSIVIGLLIVFASKAWGCYLHGTDSGECTTLTLDPIYRSTFMPFCFNAVKYPACIPKYITLPPSREFPEGRWFNNTVRKKDDWIEQSVTSHIATRIRYETSKTMKESNMNEFGDIGHTRKRFVNKPDCQLAYKNFFCWINFPRCNVQRDLTLPTCRSACENFFRTCGYEQGLWRCGKSKWFNGYEPEIPQLGGGWPATSGNKTYLREYMTGQPFRKNKYTLMGNEVPICTPALLGAAPRGPALVTGLWATLVISVSAWLAF